MSNWKLTKSLSFWFELIHIKINLVLELMHRCDKKGKLLPLDMLKRSNKIKVFNSPYAEFVTLTEQVDSKNQI
jgi:transcriptional antiterminator RfaH